MADSERPKKVCPKCKGLGQCYLGWRSPLFGVCPACYGVGVVDAERGDQMTTPTEKTANLFRSLWRDAENEGQELRDLLRGAQEEVCSLTCRSYFPPGHVPSEADHSAKCRAITAALTEPTLSASAPADAVTGQGEKLP